jgi:octaprenyl-diphosphate synthase
MKQSPVLGREPEISPVFAEKPALFQPIANDLACVDEVLRDELKSRYQFVNGLVEHVAGFQGKRLRPALLLLVARAAGSVRHEHFVLAAVVEMIHTATLVHDDVLDQALVRRHRATVNAEWGTETSVLLGDYLFTHAFHLASSLESSLACRLIGRATNIVCEGELHQIHCRGHFELSEEEYFEIIQGKTAELCAVSCQLGAHFAGASPALERAMDRYGRNLGMAFQIADDLLDLLGEERATGKSLGTDVEQQKLTLPLIWVMRHGSRDTVRCVRAILSSGVNHKIEQLRPILQQTEAFAYTRGQAERFAAAALHELEDIADSPAVRTLAHLTHFVTQRSA